MLSLTKVIDPLGHTTNYKYAYADGQLISTTDQNSIGNKLVLYNDSLRRPTETDRPDGGSTVLTYNDTPPTTSVDNSNENQQHYHRKRLSSSRTA